MKDDEVPHQHLHSRALESIILSTAVKSNLEKNDYLEPYRRFAYRLKQLKINFS